MNLPLYIANRLSLSSGSNKSSPAVTVAVMAVAISIIVMTASVAIVLGFKKEIRDKVIGFNGHISLYTVPVNQDDENLLLLSPSLKGELNSIDFITEYSLQAAIPAVLKTSDNFKGIYLKTVSGENIREFLNRNLEKGSIPDFDKEENNEKIIISNIAARQLGLDTASKIDVYFFSDDVRVRRLQVAAVYNSHFENYDDVMMYGAPSLIGKMGGIDANYGTYLQIMTDNFDKIEEYTIRLQSILNEAVAEGRLFRIYRTDNVLHQGAGYFNWLSLLDTNVVVILILMMIVGSVTLVSGMLIIILEKKKFIGLMKSLGCSTSRLRKIFIFLSMKIVMLGLFIGNVFILTLVYCQDKYHFLPLDAESYYINFVPVSLGWFSVLLLNAGVVFITYLVLVLPSRFIAGISPAETMRYE